MNQKPADETQQPHIPDQTVEMLKSFQAAVLAASNELLHLTNTLHFIYGAALAGSGSQSLKSTLAGQDTRLMETFEAVLDVFRRRNIPILEEYTDLFPFILDTAEGVRRVVVEGENGTYLRNLLHTRGDLSTLLDKLMPVQNLVQRPVEKTGRKMGRPTDAINEYIGRRANEIRNQHQASWSQVLDLLITELTEKERTAVEDRAIQKLLDMRLKMNKRRAGGHLGQLAKYYKDQQT